MVGVLFNVLLIRDRGYWCSKLQWKRIDYDFRLADYLPEIERGSDVVKVVDIRLEVCRRVYGEEVRKMFY